MVFQGRSLILEQAGHYKEQRFLHGFILIPNTRRPIYTFTERGVRSGVSSQPSFHVFAELFLSTSCLAFVCGVLSSM